MKELSVLVEAAQSGDSEAYDALLQRFQHMAYATAYRSLGDHHLAQDVVQGGSRRPGPERSRERRRTQASHTSHSPRSDNGLGERGKKDV